ncbi:hypothetical protein ACFTAO_41855 [Paenibacillus rhizoplanae]
MELIVINKEGAIWNIAGIVTDITWKTTRTGKPATLELTLVDSGMYQHKKSSRSATGILCSSAETGSMYSTASSSASTRVRIRRSS